MNILITGGAGYIGSVTAQFLLDKGHNVSVIDPLWFDKNIPLSYRDNPHYTFIHGDIRDPNVVDDLLNNNVDCVVHAAAVVGEPASKKFPELTYKINYEASVKLIDKLRNSSIKRIIYLSTCSNYGISDNAASEESPLRPLSLYAETKVDVERYLMRTAKDLDWIICRLSTVYGVSPRMRFDLTVNDFTMNAFTKRCLEIFLPYTYRPYIHVVDIARILSKMIDKFDLVKNNVFNVGFDDENYKKMRIVEIIKKYIPATRIEITNEGADIRDYRVNFTKLRKILGITNAYTVEKGVEEIIDALRAGRFSNPRNEMYYNTCPKLGD